MFVSKWGTMFYYVHLFTLKLNMLIGVGNDERMNDKYTEWNVLSKQIYFDQISDSVRKDQVHISKNRHKYLKSSNQI